MSYQEILYSVDSGVATVTLNRPDKLNAITPLLFDEMRAALYAADADDAVRIIMITGAGKGFCAGADLGRLDSLMADGGASTSKAAAGYDPVIRPDFQERYTFLPALRKPVIAAINGATVGAGLVLALYCDIRIASDTAMLTTGFARRGLIAEMGSAWRLTQLVGHGRAMDLLLRSPRVSGKEAAAMGLVEFSVPPEQFVEFTRNYVLEMSNQVSPRSVRVLKKEMWNVPFQTLAESLREARIDLNESMVSEDFREGVAHFKEKRPPRFTGK